tara:strand:- start:70 stop:408 length:339 start_codon:yes stop_codon:yes gene_type:complete
MSKYIYINSFPAGSAAPNNIVNLVPVDEIGDFETEFNDAPLRLQFTILAFANSNNSSSQNYNISITNGMSASEAKEVLDQAVSKVLLEAHNSVEEVINFFPPSGISISSLGS